MNNFSSKQFPLLLKAFPLVILSPDEIIHSWVSSVFIWVRVLNSVRRSHFSVITPTDALRFNTRIQTVWKSGPHAVRKPWKLLGCETCWCERVKACLMLLFGRPWRAAALTPAFVRTAEVPVPLTALCFTPLSSRRWESSPHNINLTSRVQIASCCCRRQDQWSTKSSFSSVWSLWKELWTGYHERLFF